jgi:phage-related protein
MVRLIVRNTRIAITEKPIGWRGSSLADVRALPEKARREIGHQLALLQRGQQPTDWKPIPRVGPGTIEVRVHLETELRVLVVCKFEEAIYVLHAFIKRSRQTAERDIQLAADRYRALARERS